MNKYDLIAIFKYGLIASVIHHSKINQTKYFKELSRNEYIVPGKEEMTRFKWRTFKKWLHLYRAHGYDGLKPVSRSDKGKTRKMDDNTKSSIKELYLNNEYKTVSNFYRALIQLNVISPETFTEATLRNYLKANNLKMEYGDKKPRKCFEVVHINILWIADFMHGPYVRAGKKKMKTYLCAIIDDHSRLIVGALFFLAESSLSLQITLKNAVLTYGIPQKLYCDNGKVFVSGYIHMVCARIGTALIHSKPYDSSSRGKIERWFRTVRMMFLPNINYDSSLTLDSLNKSFKNWLNNEYHHNIHSSIAQKPIDRYINDIPNVKIREISKTDTDKYFYHTIYRKVKNDSTISFNKIFYEAPVRFIGKKVEIRYPLDNPDDLRIFKDKEQICSLTKLDKHLNSENTLKYYNSEDKNV